MRVADSDMDLSLVRGVSPRAAKVLPMHGAVAASGVVLRVEGCLSLSRWSGCEPHPKLRKSKRLPNSKEVLEPCRSLRLSLNETEGRHSECAVPLCRNRCHCHSHHLAVRVRLPRLDRRSGCGLENDTRSKRTIFAQPGGAAAARHRCEHCSPHTAG